MLGEKGGPEHTIESPQSSATPWRAEDGLGHGLEEARALTVAEIVASDETLTNNFISSVVERVDRRVQEREARRQKIWNIVYVIVGFIGVTGATAQINQSVSNTVDAELQQKEEAIFEKVRNDIRETLDEDSEVLREELREQAVYQQFAYMALTLRFEEGFSNAERDGVLKLLRQISASESLRDQPDFSILLENVVDSFDSAGLHPYLEQLLELFEDEMMLSSGIAHTMMQHYGRRLVGSNLPAERWDDQDLVWLGKFEEACDGHNIPEISLPYRVLVEYMVAGETRTDVTDRLLGSVQLFRLPEEKATFHRIMLMLTDADFWQKTPTPEGEAIARVSSAFRADHKDVISAQLRDQVVQGELVALASRYAATGGIDLAHAMLDEIRRADSSFDGYE